MKQEKWNDPEVMTILTSADIIIITETWIHDGETDDYKINGYIGNHCCAPRRDVAVFIFLLNRILITFLKEKIPPMSHI